MKHGEKGMQFFELLIVLAVAGLVTAVSIPAFLSAWGGAVGHLAAAEVATAFRTARTLSNLHAERLGIKFRVDPGGFVTWTVHRDGDGDGIRSDDIARGIDPQLGPARRLAHVGRKIRFGFPPGRAPRDPDRPSRRLDRLDDPIRFNRSDIASFSPFEGSTPGTAYLTDSAGRLWGVRITGRTGRVRVMRYDTVSERWY